MREIREAGVEDAGTISRIHADAWRGSYRELIPQHYLDRLPDEYWTPSIRAWLMDGRFSALMLLEDGQPVGAVIFGRGRDESPADWGEILTLYVLPQHARRGAGSLLLQQALSVLRSDGYSDVYLWAIDGAAAADAFYRKHGFLRTEETVSYRIGGKAVQDVRYILPGKA